jgi:tRNA dimethylallyltransferase
MSRPLLVVLLGPTAVGKTAVAVALAKRFHTGVVSADSRQFYKEIPVGTAQPSIEEQRAVPHFFIATHSIRETLDAGRYSREARALLEKEFASHPVLILAGGSGLYIDAVINGFDELPQQDAALRGELQALYEEKGITALQEELEKLDPEYFTQVDKSNPSRLIRAIEVCRLTGKKYSELRSGKNDALPFRVVKIGLELPRKELYDRINRRVDQMMESGLEEEARNVYPQRTLNALQTVGYKELFDHFDGKTTKEKAIELIRQHTRNFAKRQMTWWRKDAEIRWFNPGDVAGMEKLIEEKLKGED